MSTTRRSQRNHTSGRSTNRPPQRRAGASTTSGASTQKPVTTATAQPKAKGYQEQSGAAYGQTKAQTYQERAAARATRSGSGQNRRRRGQRSWLQTRWPLVTTIVGVVLVVAIFLALANHTTGYKSTGAPADVVQQTTHVPTSVFETVGVSSLKNPFTATPAGTPMLKGPTGKPELLYMGAEYCPYCAAERWSMVVALSRFGTFSNLGVTKSGDSPEPYPQTNTFTFYGSAYTSQYLDFVSVEMQTNQKDGLGAYTMLQTPNSAEKAVFSQYDQPPYASQAGGIPFLSLGNQYIEVSAGFIPNVLTNLTWQDIAGALSNPQSPSTIEIVADANYLTAGICQITNNQPSSVCDSAPIQSIVKNFPAAK